MSFGIFHKVHQGRQISGGIDRELLEVNFVVYLSIGLSIELREEQLQDDVDEVLLGLFEEGD